MTSKVRITSNLITEPAPKRWSNCMRAGDFIFVSGLTSRGNDGVTIEGKSEYEQSIIIFTKMKNLLEAGGAKMDDVVKLTLFVTNIANNKEVWKAREKFFTGDFPAASLVEVKGLATPEILVEIEAIAYTG